MNRRKACKVQCLPSSCPIEYVELRIDDDFRSLASGCICRSCRRIIAEVACLGARLSPEDDIDESSDIWACDSSVAR